MAPAKFKISTIEIDISKLEDYKFISEQETCIFDGFMKVYNPDKGKEEESDSSDNDEDAKEEVKLPKLPKKGDKLEISNVISTQEYKKPPARFDDGSIIGKMKKIGIGRPSTYNSIVKKIQDANYVVIQNNTGVEKKSITLKLDSEGKIKEESKTILLGKDTKKCVPTEMGKIITKFLMEHFPEIMIINLPSNMEKQLDEIAEGNLKHTKMLKDFYKDFEPLVEKLNESIEEDLYH